MGSGEGLCPPPVGGLGLAPRKKNNFALKNYAILSKFWYFFPILQQKVGGLSPSPESGGPIPCPPCSDAYEGYSLNSNFRPPQFFVSDPCNMYFVGKVSSNAIRWRNSQCPRALYCPVDGSVVVVKDTMQCHARHSTQLRVDGSHSCTNTSCVRVG